MRLVPHQHRDDHLSSDKVRSPCLFHKKMRGESVLGQSHHARERGKIWEGWEKRKRR